MKTISSRENTLYKTLKKLGNSAKERRKTGNILLDGIHLVSAHHEAGGGVETVAVSAKGLDDPEIQAFLNQSQHVSLALLDEALFNEVSTVDTPTGILAIVKKPRQAPPPHPDFAVFLEDIQDPGNLGSILRSAAAAGVKTAYLSGNCADAWSPKVLRAGMGAHFCLAVQEHVDLVRLALEFQGTTVATELGAAASLFDLDLTGATAFIIGNEGAGISSELLQAARQRANIPMPGAVESLNAAAAAAICLFERVRQTSHAKGR